MNSDNKNLYEDKLNRDFNATDENDRLLSAYDKVLKEQYMLAEDATADAKGTLDAIIGSFEKQKSKLKDQKSKANFEKALKTNGIYKMALGMKKSYEKNKGFSKDQANWLYKTSKAMF